MANLSLSAASSRCRHVIVSSETATHYRFACKLCGQAIEIPLATERRMRDVYDLAALIKAAFQAPGADASVLSGDK